MVKLVISNLVLAWVAFLLGWYWPRESPPAIVLRYPPASCGSELQRLRDENRQLGSRISSLKDELYSREDVILIVRETVRIVMEGLPEPGN